MLSHFSRVQLCDPIDGSPPGSPVPGILQARTLEWVAISFSNAWKWKVKVKSLSHVWLFATPWTAAYQAPPSMGFFKQEHWSGVPLPSLSAELKAPPNVTCWLFGEHSLFQKSHSSAHHHLMPDALWIKGMLALPAPLSLSITLSPWL